MSEQATGSEEVPTAQTGCVVAADRREGQSVFVLRAGKRPFLTTAPSDSPGGRTVRCFRFQSGDTYH